jgi:hypothetical protein
MVALPDGSIIYGGETLTPVGSLTNVAVGTIAAHYTNLNKTAHGLTVRQGDIVAITSATTASNVGIYTCTTGFEHPHADYIQIDGVLSGSDTDMSVTLYRNAQAISAVGQRKMMTLLTKPNQVADMISYAVDQDGGYGWGSQIFFGSHDEHWGSGEADHKPFSIYRYWHREGDIFTIDAKGDVSAAGSISALGGLINGGNVTATAIGSLSAPTVTSNGTGVVTWTYVYVVKFTDGTHSAASAAGSVATGPADLTGLTNTIRIPYIAGAYAVDVYRTVAGTTPSSTGKIIADQKATLNASSYTYCYDTALAGDSATAPVTDTTGIISGAGGYFSGNVGIGNASPTVPLHIYLDANSPATMWVTNPNTGAAAKAQILVGQGTTGNNYSIFQHWGSNFTTSGLAVANRAGLLGYDTGGLVVGTGMPYPLIFGTNNIERGSIDTNGNFTNVSAQITAGTGTGLTVNVLGNLNRQVYKVTVTYAGFSAAALTADHTIATLPAKTKIVGFYADTTTPFTGGGVTAASLTVGKSAGGVEYIATHDVLSAAITRGLADADMGTELTRAAAIQGGAIVNWIGTTTVSARLTTVTANTNALTAGSVTFYIVTERF